MVYGGTFMSDCKPTPSPLYNDYEGVTDYEK